MPFRKVCSSGKEQTAVRLKEMDSVPTFDQQIFRCGGSERSILRTDTEGIILPCPWETDAPDFIFSISRMAEENDY